MKWDGAVLYLYVRRGLVFIPGVEYYDEPSEEGSKTALTRFPLDDEHA